jgi:acetolactate synthase I/II/III large subunit
MSDAQIRFGSDAIVALLTQLGIEYAAFNPGASFRGIHDSLLHMPHAPMVIQCCHEEIAMAVAHGYAKAAGKPMVTCTHDIVGLQHASMAIFNAWCDRVPVLVLGGGGPRSATRRRPWIEWIHSAFPQGQVVRDFVKWDDEPATVSDVPESVARAHRVATSRPRGPVYVNFDVSVQEDELPDGYVLPSLAGYANGSPPVVPVPELEGVAAALAQARRPVILVDRMESPDAAVGLAEALGAPVLDRGNRVGFPSSHPLNVTGAELTVLARADFIVGFEVDDMFGAIHAWRPETETYLPIARNAKVVHVGLKEYALRSWAADHQRLVALDHSLTGDADAAARDLALLVRERIKPEDAARRSDEAAQVHDAQRTSWLAQAAQAAEIKCPIHPAAIVSVLWQALDGQSWCLANDWSSGWARRLWPIDRAGQHLGGNGGGGIGYGMGAAIGAALAHCGDGTLVVDIQGDGDLLYTPSALWTLAKYELPVLVIINNNRAYLNSLNHARQIGRRRGHQDETVGIGTSLSEPDVDFGDLARAFGVWAERPVRQTSDLERSIARAIEVVCSGRPALVDVVTGP